MPGMLSEQAPSSGPGVPTPTATAPGAGAPPGGVSPGSGHSPPADIEALKNRAVELVYGERFDQLIQMFQKNGPDKFARSMAIAVNTAINEIEKQQGPIGPEAAAEVGSDLLVKLFEDMLIKPKDGMRAVVEGVKAEQLQETLPAILVMYADAHPEVSKQDVQAVMLEVSNQTKQSGGAGQAPDSAQSAPPAGAPVAGGPM